MRGIKQKELANKLSKEGASTKLMRKKKLILLDELMKKGVDVSKIKRVAMVRNLSELNHILEQINPEFIKKLKETRDALSKKEDRESKGIVSSLNEALAERKTSIKQLEKRKKMLEKKIFK